MNQIKSYCEALQPGIKQTGKAVNEPVEIFLRAGRLTMMLRDGVLRYISAGSNELLRMIYAAVRARDWVTVKPVFSDEEFDIKPDSFLIRFTCNYLSEEVDFTARYELAGNKDDSLVLSMDGIANKSFLKNRIGFCILHPIENYAGIACNTEHSDSSSEQLFFPEEISPHQVFRDVLSMNWQINKLNCRLDLQGDVFETEDQRNWTDASYKTYSTPLSIPYPALIEKGTKIHQIIKFRADGTIGKSYSQPDTTVVKIFPEKVIGLPSVGICRPPLLSALKKEEIELLRPLHFDHYRIDLHLFVSNWQQQAELGCNESFDLDWPVEFALFMDDNAGEQIKNFIFWYSKIKPSVSSFLLFHRSLPVIPDSLARLVIPLLRGVNPDFKIATGTNASFVQLNRNRTADNGNDCICYSVQPQEHASDNLTLIENLKAQEYTVKSARKFSGNKDIIISPVTLQRRFNANSGMIEVPWSGNGIPSQVDSRMMSLFGACWTTGSLKYLSEAGADSVTYYYTAGERGIIQGESDSKWPFYFKSVKGMVFPVYFVFRYLLDNKQLNLTKSASSRPLVIDSLSMTDGHKLSLILVNFTGNLQPVKIDCCSGKFRIRTLNADSFAGAVSDYQWTGKEGEKVIDSGSIFKYEPYSINFIEGWLKR
jgi:hypothetical protein